MATLTRRDGFISLNAPTYTNVGGASVYVCLQPNNANVANPALTPIPPAPLATIYANSSGTPLANPVLTDGNGRYFYYAVPGLYTEVLCDPVQDRFYPIVLSDQLVGSSGSGGGTVVSVAVISSSLSVAGSPVVLAGSIDVELPVVSPGQVLGLPLSAPAPGVAQPFTLPNPSTGLLLQTNAVTNTDQLRLNLVSGSNITLTASGTGDVTIDSTVSLPPAYDVPVFAPGLGTNNQKLLRIQVSRGVTFPAISILTVQSWATASANATADTTFTFKKNGTAFCTVLFAAGSATGTFTQLAASSFTPGDLLELDGPATADTTLADIGITLLGYRIS